MQGRKGINPAFPSLFVKKGRNDHVQSSKVKVFLWQVVRHVWSQIHKKRFRSASRSRILEEKKSSSQPSIFIFVSMTDLFQGPRDRYHKNCESLRLACDLLAISLRRACDLLATCLLAFSFLWLGLNGRNAWKLKQFDLHASTRIVTGTGGLDKQLVHVDKLQINLWLTVGRQLDRLISQQD
jgi:hypothetical protein